MQFNGVDYGRAKLGTSYQSEKQQSRFVAGDGSVRTQDKTVESELMTITFPRLTHTQFLALRHFLTKVANYSANHFSIVDDHGEAFTVYWWDSKLKAKERGGRLFSATVTVRVKN